MFLHGQVITYEGIMERLVAVDVVDMGLRDILEI